MIPVYLTTSLMIKMEEQSKLYADMSQAFKPNQGQTNHGHLNQSLVNFDAGPEFRLLEEAKDILDELGIMRDVNLKQAASLEILSSLPPVPSRSHKMRDYFLQDRPRYRSRVMEEVVERAKSAYNAINHIIELKQSQGNLLQATTIADLMKSNNQLAQSSKEILQSTKDTLQQSKKSGETLMVVSGCSQSILYLPLEGLCD